MSTTDSACECVPVCVCVCVPTRVCVCVSMQHAVGRAEELVQSHEEHRRCLQQFRAWLEQEQEALSAHTPLEGDVDSLENTLQKLQVCGPLEIHISPLIFRKILS